MIIRKVQRRQNKQHCYLVLIAEGKLGAPVAGHAAAVLGGVQAQGEKSRSIPLAPRAAVTAEGQHLGLPLKHWGKPMNTRLEGTASLGWAGHIFPFLN